MPPQPPLSANAPALQVTTATTINANNFFMCFSLVFDRQFRHDDSVDCSTCRIIFWCVRAPTLLLWRNGSAIRPLRQAGGAGVDHGDSAAGTRNIIRERRPDGADEISGIVHAVEPVGACDKTDLRVAPDNLHPRNPKIVAEVVIDDTVDPR